MLYRVEDASEHQAIAILSGAEAANDRVFHLSRKAKNHVRSAGLSEFG
jgi:hypothetical protein